MMDQNTRRGRIFVNFFGKKAATARSLALLSHRTGAAIVPLISYPTRNGTYEIQYGPELRLERTGDKEADISNWTSECGRFIEDVIKKTSRTLDVGTSSVENPPSRRTACKDLFIIILWVSGGGSHRAARFFQYWKV